MKTVTIDHRQLTIAYDDAGTGPPVLLLHAFPLDRAMWRTQVAALAGEFRVLAPDLPGFGGSGELVEGFTMSAVADVAADFLSAVGVVAPATVVGLSMGGYRALSFAYRQPQRLRGLVLADTQAEPDDAAAKEGRAKTIDLVMDKGAAGLIETLLPKLLAEQTRSVQPAVVEEVRTMAARQPVAAITAAVNGLRERPDAGPFLQWIAVPTLVIVGEHDAITPPKAARSLTEKIPQASLVTIPGAGHLSNLEAPAAFNAALLAFLRTLPA